MIPKDWPGFTLRYRYKSTWYEIAVENPSHHSRGVILVELDGIAVPTNTITLRNDGEPHEVRVVMGAETLGRDDYQKNASQTAQVNAEGDRHGTGGGNDNRSEQKGREPAEHTPIST